LPVFILTFEYLHQKNILHDIRCLVYTNSILPTRLRLAEVDPGGPDLEICLPVGKLRRKIPSLKFELHLVIRERSTHIGP
jgi:hypothetical protein